MLIDSHCHIDQFPDPLAFATKCQAKQVTTVAVTNLPSHFKLALPHLCELTCINLALGFHPLAVGKGRSEINQFLALVGESKFIGEIGLDFSKEGLATKSDQQKVFECIIESISGTKKFVTLHSRGAADEVLDVLESRRVTNAVLHWFTGNSASLKRAIEMGCWFSVNPAMTRSKSGIATISHLPRDRVLTETDGPHVRVGNRPAEPTDVREVLAYLGTTWEISTAEAEDLVASNFARLTS